MNSYISAVRPVLSYLSYEWVGHQDFILISLLLGEDVQHEDKEKRV